LRWFVFERQQTEDGNRNNVTKTQAAYRMLVNGKHTNTHTHTYIYTGCPRRNVKYFGRVFLMLNYTDITQNTYIES